MIEFISSWAEQVIIAVIIATILEMILPEGNNKKYVKVVIGVYILFTIIAPVIQKISGKEINIDTNYEKYFNTQKEYEIMSNAISSTNNQSIEEIYVQNLKNDIKNKIKEKGYEATNIVIDVNLKDEASYGNINKISMDIKEIIKEEVSQNNTKNEISVESVNKIVIGNTLNTTVSSEKVDDKKKKEIKEYLSDIYSLNTKYITIN